VILYWLGRWWHLLKRATDKEWRAKVDVNAKCPACGNFCGGLEYRPAITRDLGKTLENLIIHKCKLCGYAWPEETITDIPLPRVK
jgi:rubredoxin